jgi:hypothetical protein
MDSNGFSAFSTFSVRRQAKRSLQESRKPVVAEMKARQAAKIRELGHALVDAGFLTLDEQSKAIGLTRSTTWTILRASHKGSGLSAAIIKRMLLSPKLPPGARKPYSSIIDASIVCRSRLHGSSIPMGRACIQTTGASYRISLFKPCTMSILRFMTRATRPAHSAT